MIKRSLQSVSTRSRVRLHAANCTRGQSAVEIALLLPILMILVFGIVMSGFLFYAYIQVSNAAREGARAGSLYLITRVDNSTNPITIRTLDEIVQKAIYDNSTSPAESALGYLAVNASSFVVTSDVVTTLTKPDGTAGDPTAPDPGDRLYVQVTYRYTQPILSAFVPIFPQPLIIVRNVMMEIQ